MQKFLLITEHKKDVPISWSLTNWRTCACCKFCWHFISIRVAFKTKLSTLYFLFCMLCGFALCYIFTFLFFKKTRSSCIKRPKVGRPMKYKFESHTQYLNNSTLLLFFRTCSPLSDIFITFCQGIIKLQPPYYIYLIPRIFYFLLFTFAFHTSMLFFLIF